MGTSLRRHKSKDEFVGHDSNTICDVTGFKVKRSQVIRRWEGFMVIPEAWHPRHEQDFPITAVPQKTVPDVRTVDTVTVQAGAWGDLAWDPLAWVINSWVENTGVEDFNTF